MQKALLFLFLTFSFSQLASTQDTISFHLTDYNNIVIQSILNGKDTVQLMFHTAANDVSLTTDVVKKLAKADFEKSVESKSWGGNGSVRYSQNNQLKIGNFSWDSLIVWESRHSGHHTDGKFGPNLFVDKIIELNFNQHHFILHDTLPATAASYEQQQLIVENDFLFIEGIAQIDGQKFDNRFLIHSGYSGSILLDDDFAAKHQLGKKLEIIDENTLLDAAGNKIITQKALLPFFSTGGQTFANIPASFFPGALGRQKMSIVGGDLLKRFNVFLDISHQKIYLQANQNLSSPYRDS